MSITRQGLSKHVPVAMNMHGAIEELLETQFCMQSVLKLYGGEGHSCMDCGG